MTNRGFDELTDHELMSLMMYWFNTTYEQLDKCLNKQGLQVDRFLLGAFEDLKAEVDKRTEGNQYEKDFKDAFLGLSDRKPKPVEDKESSVWDEASVKEEVLEIYAVKGLTFKLVRAEGHINAWTLCPNCNKKTFASFASVDVFKNRMDILSKSAVIGYFAQACDVMRPFGKGFSCAKAVMT